MTEIPDLILSIQTAIRGSSLADELNILRWRDFRSQETNEEWTTLLGLTAIVLTHQEYFTDFVAHWAQGLESADLKLLLEASSIHDLGEISVGDIPEPLKNGQDETKEAAAAMKLIDQLTTIDPELREELKRAYEQVIVGENAVLHLLFKAFERLEYLDTAVHIFESLQSGLNMDKGTFLIARVLAYDLPKVIAHAKQFPESIGAYLLQYQATIQSMFQYSESAVNDEFTEKFESSLTQWQSYLQLTTLADETVG
jgi:hypothetical protein